MARNHLPSKAAVFHTPPKTLAQLQQQPTEDPKPITPVGQAVITLHDAVTALDDELGLLLARLEPARGASPGATAAVGVPPLQGSSMLCGQLGAGTERLLQMRARIEDARAALEL